jgi:DnaK suppressor protein
MDYEEAQRLLRDERERVQRLLGAELEAAQEDREAANEDDGDLEDPARALEDEMVDDAIVESLRERLRAIERAEQRLADGTYGLSVRSGKPIPDERLRADPAAELTVEEAAEEANA